MIDGAVGSVAVLRGGSINPPRYGVHNARRGALRAAGCRPQAERSQKRPEPIPTLGRVRGSPVPAVAGATRPYVAGYVTGARVARAAAAGPCGT